MQQAPAKTALWFVVCGATLISLSAPLVKAASVAPSTSGFYRMAFGSIGLLVLLLIRKNWRNAMLNQWQKGWLASLLIAVFFTLDLWFWHRSIVWIGPGLATLLANFQVFILTLFGILVFSERPGIRFFSGMLLAITGLALLLLQQWPGLDAQQRLGIVFGLLTAVAYSAYMLSLRHSQAETRAIHTVYRLFQVSICTAVMLGIINAIEGQTFVIPDARNLGLLVAYGLLCQVMGWLLITRGLPGLAAGLAGLILLLQPGLSVAWDMLFFELKLSPVQWLGLLMALTGIYFGSLRGLRQQ